MARTMHSLVLFFLSESMHVSTTVVLCWLARSVTLYARFYADLCIVCRIFLEKHAFLSETEYLLPP